MHDFADALPSFRDDLNDAVARAFKPPLLIDVVEWAETRRELTTAESEYAGPYRVSTIEVARGPLLAASEPGVERISVSAAAQLLKTKTIENIVGWSIETRPGPILVYQPTEETAQKFASDKLWPMLHHTPVLTKVFGGHAALKAKSSDNKITEKRYPGGWVSVLSAAAEVNFGMHSVPLVLMDEVSKWKPIKGMGDPIDLAIQRTEFFAGTRLIVTVSTPKIIGDCRITDQVNRGDLRRPFLDCPHCGESHAYVWEDVRWDKDDQGRGLADTARLECPHCAHAWTEHERIVALSTKGGVTWRQTRPFTCCGVAQDPVQTKAWIDTGSVHRATCVECGAMAVPNKHASFADASGIYSPINPLSYRVSAWLDAQGSVPKLMKFVNEILARPFNLGTEQTHFEGNPEGLAQQLEVQWPTVPAGVQVITAGIDTQDDRLEVELVGWGSAYESWSLDYHTLAGSPGDDAVWQALDDLLLTPMQTEDGRTLRVHAAAIDTGGHFTDAVHAFCGRRTRRRVFAVQGANARDYVHRAPIWPRKMSATVKAGSRLHNIGTNLAKDLIARMITATTGGQPGPYYMHIPSRQGIGDWIKSITTSEKRISFKESGRPASRWVPNKGPNHSLDCRVYALAAYEGLIATGGHRRGVIEAPGAAALPAPAPAAAVSSDGTAPTQAPPAAAQAQPARKRRPRPPAAAPGFGGFSRGRGGGSWL